MSKPININFTVNAPVPVDSRMQVSTFAGLASIAVKYIGLRTYVVDEDKDYRYKASGWVAIEESGGGGGGAGVWGSITGTLGDQTDLVNELDLKFDKAGGTITGATDVTDILSAFNLVILGSAPSVKFPYFHVVDVPATTSSTGVVGQAAYESGFLYICVATDTWERVAIATW